MGQNASTANTSTRIGGGGRVGEIGACERFLLLYISIQILFSNEILPAAAGAPSLAGAISSAGIVVHKLPPRSFKPAIKGRVGASVIATLIEAVAEMEATVRSRHNEQLIIHTRISVLNDASHSQFPPPFLPLCAVCSCSRRRS